MDDLRSLCIDGHCFGNTEPAYTQAQTDDLLADKQDLLTAGEGIDITNNTISTEVTQSELDAVETKADTAITDATTAINSAITAIEKADEAKEIANSKIDCSDLATCQTIIDMQSDISDKADASDVYTKTQTDTLLNGKQNTLTAGTGISITNDVISCTLDTDIFVVVQSLPAVGEENKIYLVPKQGGGFTEWAYINGAWEEVGDTDIDLSNYYNKTETDALLDDKADASSVYTKTETDTLLSDKADASTVYTKTETDTLLNAKADQATTYTKTETDDLLDTKQDVLTAGQGISITDNEIENTAFPPWAEFDGRAVYYPRTAVPTNMERYSALLSEAVGLNTKHRDLIVAGGLNITLKSATPAGGTTFVISNTSQNRFYCSCGVGGRLALGEFEAAEKTVEIVSVLFENGDPVVPFSGGTVSSNNIIITTAEPLSDEAVTKVRVYGYWGQSDILSVGQGNRSVSGKCLQVGQALNSNGGNQVFQMGNSNYNEASNTGQIGSQHINKYVGVFQAGTGHDSTNGSDGLTQVGRYSECDTNTAFAVGNGTSATARSNAFEVTKDGRAKASGTPTDPDDLATKAYVDAGGGSIALTTYGNADFTYLNDCVAYSTSSGNANEPTAVKYGRVVNLAGAIKNVNAREDSAAYDIGTVPAGCEPLKTQYILSQGTAQNKFMLTIRPDGTLNCSRYSSGATALAVPANAWLNINATYISAV